MQLRKHRTVQLSGFQFRPSGLSVRTYVHGAKSHVGKRRWRRICASSGRDAFSRVAPRRGHAVASRCYRMRVLIPDHGCTELPWQARAHDSPNGAGRQRRYDGTGSGAENVGDDGPAGRRRQPRECFRQCRHRDRRARRTRRLHHLDGVDDARRQPISLSESTGRSATRSGAHIAARSSAARVDCAPVRSRAVDPGADRVCQSTSRQIELRVCRQGHELSNFPWNCSSEWPV